MQVALDPMITGMPSMASSKGRQPVGKQINFRAPPDLQSRLEDTAETLGLDVSALVRLVLTESLHPYESRAAEVRSRNPGPKKKPKSEG